MAGEVRAEYTQLAQVASRFTNQCNAVQQMLNLVRSREEVLEAGSWIGRGFNAFEGEMNSEVFPAINRLIQAMEEGNQATTQISNLLQQAEEEASAPFRV